MVSQDQNTTSMITMLKECQTRVCGIVRSEHSWSVVVGCAMYGVIAMVLDWFMTGMSIHGDYHGVDLCVRNVEIKKRGYKDVGRKENVK